MNSSLALICLLLLPTLFNFLVWFVLFCFLISDRMLMYFLLHEPFYRLVALDLVQSSVLFQREKNDSPWLTPINAYLHNLFHGSAIALWCFQPFHETRKNPLDNILKCIGEVLSTQTILDYWHRNAFIFILFFQHKHWYKWDMKKDVRCFFKSIGFPAIGQQYSWKNKREIAM